MKAQNDEGLSREIGIVDVAANVVNLTIGAGIFVLPALVYEKLGSSTFLAYIICSILIFFLMMCFAEMGSKTSSSGSVFGYVQDAYGPYASFVTINVYWFGFGLISDAAIANALLAMMSTIYPFLNTLVAEVCVFFSVFGILALINIRGVRYGTVLVRLLTFGKLIPFIALLVFGWPKVQVSNLQWVPEFDIEMLGDGCLILFFAFVGGEATLMASGEIKSPKRNIPLGLFFGITAAVILYILMQILGQGVLGSDLLIFKEAPFLQVSSIIFGDFGSTFMLLATAVAILGAVSGDLLVMPRLLFAASKNNFFPKLFSVVHGRFKTPYVAILAYSFFGFVFSLSASFKELAILSSTACLLTYLMVILSLLRLRGFRRSEMKSDRFAVNKFVLPPALLGILWLLSRLSYAEILAMLLFWAILSACFFRKRLGGFFKVILRKATRAL